MEVLTIKEIKVKENISRFITIGEREVTKYETEDGQLFDTEQHAIIHEKYITNQKIIKNIPKVECDQIVSFPEDTIRGWYFLKNEHEAQLLYIKNIEELIFPDWFLMYTSYYNSSGDGQYGAISKTKLRNELRIFIDSMPEDIMRVDELV